MQPRCERCGLSLPAGQRQCGHCLREPPPFERCICAADYRFPWDRVITRMKYRGRSELAAALADLLVQAALRDDVTLPQAFVAVPMSAPRLAERGYDQAWELARRLGRALAVAAHARLLERRFDGRHQAALSRADRLRNLRGAFVVTPARQHLVGGAHLALVDDVMTTGATLHEAALALRAAGARRVDVWVVARTPDDDPVRNE